MKIRKYVGDSAREAMDKMREELGADAVLLNAKTIREDGLMKYFRKPKFEITAAYEEVDEKKEVESKNVKLAMDDIKGELEELRGLLEILPAQEIEKHEQIHSKLKPYLRIMVQNGINFNIALSILKDIEENTDLETKGEKLIHKLLEFKLKEIMGESEPISVGNTQKRIFFVGPTGVGKTTTLAKIAASLVMEDKYNIGLITSDTYRVGAVDQLKIYSDILNLPLEVAYNGKDMEKSFDIMEGKDIVLVDTAGRNHKNKEQTDELREILNSTENKDVYLIVSATSDIKVLETLLLKYNFLGDYRVMVTKVDEANGYGSIFNVSYIFDREISYYTTGQDVPEDISILHTDEIVSKLIEEM